MSTVNIYDTHICLADIGAAGGIHKRWKKFRRMHVLGFEPDSRTYKQLPNNENYTWFNTALSNIKGSFPLYITSGSTNTSMLMPNYALINRLAFSNNDFSVVSTEEIECETLDNICMENNFNPDVVKIDTQGTELNILKGSVNLLKKSIFAVESEVEFLPLYEDQPLFTQVHEFMSDNNFQLMDYGNILHVKGNNSIGIGGAKSNMISCDALYFRDLEATVNGIKDNIMSLPAIIAVCCSYGYEDYAIEICTEVKNSSEKLHGIANEYIDFLTTKRSIFQKLINKINPSDGSVRRIFKFARKFIPIKHASWLPGLGNDH